MPRRAQPPPKKDAPTSGRFLFSTPPQPRPSATLSRNGDKRKRSDEPWPQPTPTSRNNTKKPKTTGAMSSPPPRMTRSLAAKQEADQQRLALENRKKGILADRRAARHPRSPGDLPPPDESLPIITRPPTFPLAILVFGDGRSAQLGLGPHRISSRVPVPNTVLDPDDDKAWHVVQVSCGTAHVLGLTEDNKIVSWGANGCGALGRDTRWEWEMDEETLNPLESTPKEVARGGFPRGVTIAQVVAGDNYSLALTDRGMVYAWGTFLDPDNKPHFGTSPSNTPIAMQPTPLWIPELSNIKQLACGANHALALDKKGVIWTWGLNHKNQLGKRPRTRGAASSSNLLKPQRVEIFNRKAVLVASGAAANHSFALDDQGDVWAWGDNADGQAGCSEMVDGETVLSVPQKVPRLCRIGVKSLSAGEHYSAAVTDTGECLLWGRINGGQLGVDFSSLPHNQEDILSRPDGRHTLLTPTPVTSMGNVAQVACHSDHTVFVAEDGTGFGSGQGADGQLGNGGDRDSETPLRFRGLDTLYGRRMLVAGAGAGFSVIGADNGRRSMS